MADLEFHIYKVSSEFGDWLAAFEGQEMIFLGSYAAGKKVTETALADLFETNYHFNVGRFVPAKWTKGNFWKAKHKIKLQGTDFQMKVWLELIKIPCGKTVTYTDIAKKIKKPAAYRAVASAVAQNPVAVYIPCHRVVAKGTSKSAKLKYHWGSKLKQLLLENEGSI
jgi:methylated-DNA-[protein]-cysteine S-methyltransferase/AraC family transcriptional regulator of adaptative response/methylated-DNA-[protein]-cysteine methyltransferase